MDETSVTIGAAPEKVWAMVSDITRMGEWSPGNTGGKWILGAKGPAVGAKFLGFNKRGFIRWFTTCKVIECEQPSSFAFQVIENKMKWGFRVEPTDDGGTVLTQWRDRDKPPVAPIRAVAKVIFQGNVEAEMVEGMQQTLVAIKAKAERPA